MPWPQVTWQDPGADYGNQNTPESSRLARYVKTLNELNSKGATHNITNHNQGAENSFENDVINSVTRPKIAPGPKRYTHTKRADTKWRSPSASGFPATSGKRGWVVLAHERTRDLLLKWLTVWRGQKYGNILWELCSVTSKYRTDQGDFWSNCKSQMPNAYFAGHLLAVEENWPEATPLRWRASSR